MELVIVGLAVTEYVGREWTMNEFPPNIDAIQKCPPFVSLLPSQMKELADSSTFLRFRRGDQIFRPGDSADELFILVSGRAAISHAENDRRAVISTIWPFEVFGQCALGHSKCREATCHVPRNASAVAVPLTGVRSLMELNPRFARDMTEEISRNVRLLASRLISVLIRPKRQRLLDLLRQIASSQGVVHKSGTLIPERLTHQEIGEMIGATRETVTAILGDLRKNGVLELVDRQILLRQP